MRRAGYGPVELRIPAAKSPASRPTHIVSGAHACSSLGKARKPNSNTHGARHSGALQGWLPPGIPQPAQEQVLVAGGWHDRPQSRRLRALAKELHRPQYTLKVLGKTHSRRGSLRARLALNGPLNSGSGSTSSRALTSAAFTICWSRSRMAACCYPTVRRMSTRRSLTTIWNKPELTHVTSASCRRMIWSTTAQ